MPAPLPGSIDCDLHPAVPSNQALLPYLDDHWRDMIVQRGVHALDSISYPNNAPVTARPDWKPASGKAGVDLDRVRIRFNLLRESPPAAGLESPFHFRNPPLLI